MVEPTVTVRTAEPGDAAVLAALVRLAYRGTEGWTTEAGYLTDDRIDAAGVLAKIGAADALVLVVESDVEGRIVACCEIAHRGDGLAYFGLFAVDPQVQAAGLGRYVLAAAEDLASSRWGCHTMEMQVVAIRDELIAWYERRGYRRTGDTRPFPYDELINGVALRDDLFFVVLSKNLG